MAGTRAANRYAKAILAMAQEKGAAANVNDDLRSIGSTINSNAELRTFVENNTVGAEVKETVLTEVFASVSPVTISLFRLLRENKRFELLSAIAADYNRLYDEEQGIEIAQVTTAIPLDAETEAMVMSKISTFSDKKTVIENIVDPSIIGGFILRIGDQQYNASIASKLRVLKRELLN